MGIKNFVTNYFCITFVDSINVFDCRLSGVKVFAQGHNATPVRLDRPLDCKSRTLPLSNCDHLKHNIIDTFSI